VSRLGLPAELRRSLACTNIIENMMGAVRRVTRNDLKIIANAVLFERHPLERTVLGQIVATGLSMTLDVRRYFQRSARISDDRSGPASDKLIQVD
jgi:hypothetical protein